MENLSIFQQIVLSIFCVIAILIVFEPWLSLTSLNKLNRIADELERIRKALEKEDR